MFSVQGSGLGFTDRMGIVDNSMGKISEHVMETGNLWLVARSYPTMFALTAEDAACEVFCRQAIRNGRERPFLDADGLSEI